MSHTFIEKSSPQPITEVEAAISPSSAVSSLTSPSVANQHRDYLYDESLPSLKIPPVDPDVESLLGLVPPVKTNAGGCPKGSTKKQKREVKASFIKCMDAFVFDYAKEVEAKKAQGKSAEKGYLDTLFQ